MVEDVIRSAAARGHAGMLPMMARELVEKSKTAHNNTSVSISTEKLPIDNESKPHRKRPSSS